MNKQTKKFLSLGPLKLVKGFGRRLMILFIIYLMFMLSAWTTLIQFFDEGFGTNWIFWLVIALSVLLFVSLVVYVERQQLKQYR
jgi:magnesium-transporting ATPase (P-type)